MIPLEDNFSDVLGKALRGLGFTETEAARLAGLGPEQVRSLLGGNFQEPSARALARALLLDPEALVRLASGRYQPDTSCPATLVPVTSTYGDMTVNAYVLWDAECRDAAIFDTGADAAPILEIIAKEQLNPLGIFLTHSHPDHIQMLAELKRELDVEAWSSEFEPVPGTNTFRPGDLFNAGCNFIRTRHTPGHSPGGTTFVIEGKIVIAAIVGDALFAGSVGGIRRGYSEALSTIRREILSLPDGTILCPGHGPLTSVEYEKNNNPFFA
jgi:glyoxylase-like metal-dependent hydrolase (beta-lactamase superfamily II)